MSREPELLENEPFDEAHAVDGPDEDVASTADTPDLRDPDMMDHMPHGCVRAKGGGLTNEVIDTIPNVSQFWNTDPKKYLASPPYTRDNPACPNCE